MNIKPTISHSRHIAKTLTWRIIASLDTLLITWFVSGDVKVGLSVASLEVVTKMILYYYHERMWYNINFGVNNRSNFNKNGKKFNKTRVHGKPGAKRN